jgi:signal transduction histidine kinase
MLEWSQASEKALSAFVTLTEAIRAETDLSLLAAQAISVLDLFIPGLVSTYYDVDGPLWKARVIGEHVGPELAALLQAGLPLDTPAFAQAVEHQGPIFIDDWDAASQRIRQTAQIGAGALFPYFANGQPCGMFTAGTQTAHAWTEPERALFLAVSRSLGVAIERARQTTELREQRREAQRQAEALNAFAQLTADLSVQVDPYALIRRAQEVALSLLTPGYALYYEREGDRWRNRVQVGEVGHPELQAFIDAGPPVGQTPSVDLPWTTAQTYYQNIYAQGSETPPEMVRHVGAAASLPVIREGKTVGVFIAALFDQRAWTGADRVVLETVVGSLGLALARSVQTQALESERAGLNAFAAFTEAVGSDTDVVRLARQAAATVVTALQDVSVGYYELEDGLWKAKAWSDDVLPETVAQMRAGVPQDAANFAEVVRSRTAVFEDGWDADANHLPSASQYGMAAFLPLMVGGQVRSILAAGIPAARGWTEREQTVLRAVARGLGLALERAESSRQLDSERAGLDAFVAFTEAVGQETGELALARQASQVVRASLEAVSFVYFELEGDLWRAVVWSDDIPAQIVTDLRAGLPTTAPNFAGAFSSGLPVFVDGWDAAGETLSSASAYGAAAFLPVTVLGGAQRFVTAGTREARAWTPREQGVIRAVVRGLTLALERTDQARKLRAQRDALDVRTAALASANEELEAFAYSASHDLRTPVRHVMGFAELAQKALQQTPNAQVHQYLDVVKQGALRMTTLIDGMLTLSRVGREELKTQWVDLEQLIAQAQRDVSAEFTAQTIRWKVDTLPQVWGSLNLLQQVMTNLLSNAVKYSGSREVSEVSVRVEEYDQEWVVAVQDNGVGFDPAYASKLFGVFQRLHSEKEFAGTGIGLSTVRRIVLKHGGRVFAESPDKAGATFVFTLPKPPAKNQRVT